LSAFFERRRTDICTFDGCDSKDKPKLKHNFGLLFKKINNRFTQIQNQNLKKNDVSFQQGALLMYLSKVTDHEVSQKEISEVLNIKHTSVIGLLERLEEKGLIERSVRPDNKRYRVITLTDKGRKTVSDIWVCICKTEQKIVGSMTEEEQNLLEMLLNKIYANMDTVVQNAEQEERKKEC
jgi:DNA-binding MarR family transcriptional regulator